MELTWRNSKSYNDIPVSIENQLEKSLRIRLCGKNSKR